MEVVTFPSRKMAETVIRHKKLSQKDSSQQSLGCEGLCQKNVARLNVHENNEELLHISKSALDHIVKDLRAHSGHSQQIRQQMVTVLDHLAMVAEDLKSATP